MRKINSLQFFSIIVLGLFIISCGVQYQRPYHSKYLSVIVDELKSSPDNPIELCGQDDLLKFMDLIYCVNGNKPYISGLHALTQRDPNFRHKTKKGHTVLKFDIKCYEEIYEVYVAPDACGDNIPTVEFKEENLPEVEEDNPTM